ncbi:MAG: hypothetical protein ACJAYE_003346 [Candidatus Azotimanducaceae bacterium]|jgi:hypothetical protein
MHNGQRTKIMELGSLLNCLRNKLIGIVVLSVLIASPSRAQEALCAEVQITISQEASLERQAFEARLH